MAMALLKPQHLSLKPLQINHSQVSQGDSITLSLQDSAPFTGLYSQLRPLSGYSINLPLYPNFRISRC